MKKHSTDLPRAFTIHKIFQASLFFILLIGGITEVIAQDRQVIGKVMEEGSGPLPGVNVVVVGAPIGVVTDFEGNFSINVPEQYNRLSFSYIGYETQEIDVSTTSVLTISLVQSAQSLDEVVVIGFGEVNKRDLTGAVAKVTAEKINELPVAGFDQALQGKVSGVRVINSNAAPGGGFDIQIRGVSSLTSSSQPLVVIDGMPIADENFQAENNPLNLINPNDIASIEVLKDASSAAIYGARAAGGVVLITTKRGRTGKPSFNFNMSRGFQSGINYPEVGTREQYLQWQEDVRNHAYTKLDPGNYVPSIDASWKFSVDNIQDVYTRGMNLMGRPDFNNDLRALQYLAVDPNIMSAATILQIEQMATDQQYWFNTDTDWLDLIEGTGEIAQYNLSASGGTERTRYLISGSYYDEKGIVTNTDFERLTFNVNLDIDVNDWFTLGTKISPSWQNLNNLGGNSVENRWFNSPLYQSVQLLPPILEPFDETGAIADYSRPSAWNSIERNWGGTFYGNPLYLFEQLDRRSTFRTLANFYTEAIFLKDFKLRSAILTDYSHRQQRTFRPSTQGGRFNPPGDANFADNVVRASNSHERRFRYYWENSLTYNKTIKEKHNITALALYTQEKTFSDRVFVEKAGFSTDEVDRPAGGIVVLDPINDATDFAGTDGFIGLLGRLQYNYDNRYYLTAAFRRDGSSRFGANTLWGNFPSMAVAWRMSDEPFFRDLKFLNDLKWRFSYGETGNSAIPRGRQQPIYNSTSYITGGGIGQGFFLPNLYDPNLSWEKTEELNYGVDLSLFSGRVGLTAEYYDRTTTDMLLFVDLPQYSGYSSILTNFGELENKGYEIGLNLVPIRNRDANWNIDFNIAHNRGEIKRLFPEEQAFISGAQVSGFTDFTRGYVGGPISTFWGTVADGIYNDWDEIFNSPSAFNYSNGNLDLLRRASNAPGEIKYKDVNGDGIIDLQDQTTVGNPWPDFFWGLSSTLNFKGFDLFVQMDGTIGAEVYNAVRFEWFRQSQVLFNMPREWLSDYWTPTNTDAQYPIISSRGGINGGRYNNMWRGTFIKEDGDFTAIRTIRLGYTFPDDIAQHLMLSKLRIYANVQNPFYFTKYSGFNPEGNNRGFDPSNQGQRSNNYGVDGGNYPIQRTITLGLDVTF